MERPLKQAVRRLPVTRAELEDYMKRLEAFQDEFVEAYDNFMQNIRDIQIYRDDIKYYARTTEEMAAANRELEEKIRTLAPAQKKDLEDFWNKINLQLEDITSRLNTLEYFKINQDKQRMDSRIQELQSHIEVLEYRIRTLENQLNTKIP